MKRSPLAGQLPNASSLIDVDQLINAYFAEKPDVASESERVIFGTSGHRGCCLKRSFNEDHILAITQAICEYRKKEGISGPLFLGIDTHALSRPALMSALEVLTGHGVDAVLANQDEYTPTPVISHAILQYNQGRKTGLSDGIVVTPSHNPPSEGGFKYNPPHGGPAEVQVTAWIEARANQWLQTGLQKIPRVPFEKAKQQARRFDYLSAYVADLEHILDMDAIRGVHIGVDPLGGAGVHYWQAIADRYGLNLEVVNKEVDPTFRFMTLDWDGQIRMDPSSADAMKRLIGLKDRFDVAVACDTDHDRHGIVTKSVGLMPSNHYLAVAADYLFRHRSGWNVDAAIGKTVVTSAMMDRIALGLKRSLYETPVGFKWFVQGLLQGQLGFAGEESAGASFLRKNGTVWTTDKDGIVPALLAAEITAKTQKDPGENYQDLTAQLGSFFYERKEASITPAEKKQFQKIDQLAVDQLAGDPVEKVLTKAPGNGASIGGVKVITRRGWFAARPSGTEEIYKIYAESFSDPEHLQQILQEAEMLISQALKEEKK
ncbi:MAG: phosphoglucomutase (alpha-D-glucose-1,6-bisphosphate-dependent) [Chlamydiales bacterium]|nr:phosphoglucomutase (alpha-D-glucose-1,6-bisphosphate-dependent) [Chlamydiales bacterium]